MTVNSRLTFARHLAETKRKVDSRFNTIKAIRNLTIAVNINVLMTLWKFLIQLLSNMLFQSSHCLQFCATILRKKTTKCLCLLSSAFKLIKTNIVYRVQDEI